MLIKLCALLALLSVAFAAPQGDTEPSADTNPPSSEQQGTLFYFNPGLGACGTTNPDEDVVASVPKALFTSFQGQATNPNDNPLCQKQVQISNGTTHITAHIVDFFSGPENNIGLSPVGFAHFGNAAEQGIIHSVTWSVV